MSNFGSLGYLPSILVMEIGKIVGTIGIITSMPVIIIGLNQFIIGRFKAPHFNKLDKSIKDTYKELDKVKNAYENKRVEEILRKYNSTNDQLNAKAIEDSAKKIRDILAPGKLVDIAETLNRYDYTEFFETLKKDLERVEKEPKKALGTMAKMVKVVASIGLIASSLIALKDYEKFCSIFFDAKPADIGQINTIGILLCCSIAMIVISGCMEIANAASVFELKQGEIDNINSKLKKAAEDLEKMENNLSTHTIGEDIKNEAQGRKLEF